MDPVTYLAAHAAPADAAHAANVCLMRYGRGRGGGGGGGNHSAAARYPFGNPVSIEREHVAHVRMTPYWVAEKSDGVRVALVLTRTPGARTPVAVLLGRDDAASLLEVTCHAHFFNDSVFDAELVPYGGGGGGPDALLLLVFDAAVLAGDASVAHLPLSERRAVLDAVLPSQVVGDAAARATAVAELRIVAADAAVHVVAQPMLPLFGPRYRRDAALDDVAALHAALRHASDGYILTPEDAPAALPGTAPAVFKLKTVHTLDLRWNAGELWYASGDDDFPLHGIAAAAPFLAAARTADALWARLRDVAPGAVVEVGVHVGGVGGDAAVYLSFERVRVDRAGPNQTLCATRTFASARDAVTLADVLP
jgi:hypothetical protein